MGTGHRDNDKLRIERSNQFAFWIDLIEIESSTQLYD